jgi:hypothetical protein
MDNNLFLYRKILYIGHLAGLFHLPEVYQQHHQPWQRKLHHFYHLCVHTFMILVVIFNTVSTFYLSIQDLSEFLQCLLDSMFISGLYTDVLLMTFVIQEYLDILDELFKMLSAKILAKQNHYGHCLLGDSPRK